jgi:DNA mismatch repair protein MutS
MRMLSRLQNRVRQPREVGGILATLELLPALRSTVSNGKMSRLAAMFGEICDFTGLCDLLRRALAETLPQDTATGGFIRDGYDEKLDQYRVLLSSGQRWLSEMEAGEQARTGIKNLHIRHSGTFGYFIEVTKANLRNVPEHYIRRQTTVNGERYTTDELRRKEREIQEAQDEALRWEIELFEEVVRRVLEQAERLTAAARILAELDVYAGWGVLAREENYVRPTVNDGGEIAIRGGRHPVIEQAIKGAEEVAEEDRNFVPNDTHLDGGDCQIALVTGPNMGGKSTYIRQVALIVLLAQAGCWVPAEEAHIGLVDRIFSRIGAGDDLSRGRSTFMVEMEETAAILHGATASSLLILDEIGRGTSTYDGLSIAWAVLEHIHGTATTGPRTLFATHYHEMTRLANALPRVRNFHLAVRESGERILFLKKIVAGPADRSYGIHVAQLAGLPGGVIERARQILAALERGDPPPQVEKSNDPQRA